MFGLMSTKRYHKLKKYYAEVFFELTQEFGRLVTEFRELEESLRKKPDPVKLFLSINVNNQKVLIMSLSIKVNQASVASLVLLNLKTGQPVTDAKFYNLAAVSSDPTLLATSEDQTNAVINGVALKSGTGTVQVTSQVDYTDSNGNKVVGQSVTTTDSFVVSDAETGTGDSGGVTPPVADPVGLALNWSTPAARP